jgi:hypothetical protein
MIQNIEYFPNNSGIGKHIFFEEKGGKEYKLPLSQIGEKLMAHFSYSNDSLR